MSFLTLNQVRFAYGKQRIVDDVTFHLERGQFACLLGPSGSGKTTLLRLVAGLEPLPHGTIAMDGVLLSGNGHVVPPEQRGIGMVFQQPTLFPTLSVAQNIGFGLRNLPREDAQKRVWQLIEMVGLEGRAHHFPHELSGGQQHRVALARAMAPHTVKLLLLDEPFSHLDPQLRLQISRDARKLAAQSGITCLMVTHDADEAMRTADKLILLDAAGKLHQSGSPREVYDAPKDAYAAQALGEMNLFAARHERETVKFALGDVSACSVDERQVLQVGVRPHDVQLVSSANGIKAEIVQIACGGADDQLVLKLTSGELVMASVRVGHDCSVGSHVRLACREGAVKLF